MKHLNREKPHDKQNKQRAGVQRPLLSFPQILALSLMGAVVVAFGLVGLLLIYWQSGDSEVTSPTVVSDTLAASVATALPDTPLPPLDERLHIRQVTYDS